MLNDRIEEENQTKAK